MSCDEMAAAVTQEIDGRVSKDRIALRKLCNKIRNWLTISCLGDRRMPMLCHVTRQQQL